MQISDTDLRHIFTHALHDLERLKGETILVTGASGFFGRWMCASLRPSAQVLAMARKRPSGAEGEWIEQDVRQPLSPGIKVDSVIHLATPASLSLSTHRPKEMIDIIVEGAKGMVATVQNTGAKNFIFTSSGAVNRSESQYDAYAQGKRAAEEIFLSELPKVGCAVKIARCYAFSGPGLPLDTHYALGNFVGQAILGKAIEVKSSGTALRSYLYAADLTIWLLRILAQGESGAIYNVGSDQPISIKDLAEEVSVEVARFLKTAPVAVRIGEGASGPDYIPDVSKARRDLGLDVWISRVEGIRRMIGFIRN